MFVGRDEAAVAKTLAYQEVDQSMMSTRRIVVSSLVTLVFLLPILMRTVPLGYCIAWALLFLAYIGARRWLTRSYFRLTVEQRQARMDWWPRAMQGTSLTFGLVWGTAAMIAFPYSSTDWKFFWTLAEAMILSVSARTLTLPQFYAMLGVSRSLMCIAWLVWGGELGILVAGGLIALSLFFVQMSRHNRAGLVERSRLLVRNEDLAQALQQQNKLLEHAADSKTALLAAASHDLRQPVHALGLSMELMSAADPAALHRRLHSARACVDSLGDMLTNLLDFTRLDLGTFPSEPKATPLMPILDQLRQSFELVASRKRLSLYVVDTEVAVWTDVHLLRRMLFNLVSNALKFTRHGSVKVDVLLSNGQVTVQVIDTGCGIPEEHRAEIFLDYVTSRVKAAGWDEGIGLGLGIVRRGAKLLGHSISVDSTVGKGSTFSLHLGQATDEPPAANVSQATGDDQAGGVVAVVENDPLILENLLDTLKSWGYEPIGGESPAQVQAVLGALQLAPRLILSDLHLGHDADGFDAVRTIRVAMEDKAIPAVILTGDLSPVHEERARAHDVMLAYKPLQPLRLKELIAKSVSGGAS